MINLRWHLLLAEVLPDTGSCRITQRYCYVYSFRRTRTLPQDCTIFSSLLLLCFYTPSLPWLATVWTYPLGTQGRSWRLMKACFSTNKKWGCRKDLYVGAPQGPAWLQKQHLPRWKEAGWPKQGWRWGHNSMEVSIITVSAIYWEFCMSQAPL